MTRSQPSSSEATTCGQLAPGSATSSSRPRSRPASAAASRPAEGSPTTAHQAPERDAPAVLSNSLTLLGMYVQNLYFDFLYGHQVDNKGLPTQRFTAP